MVACDNGHDDDGYDGDGHDDDDGDGDGGDADDDWDRNHHVHPLSQHRLVRVLQPVLRNRNSFDVSFLYLCKLISVDRA